MSVKSFVNLHVHTSYSLLDGLIKVPELVSWAKDQNLPACCVTDHGNMMSMVKLFKECTKAGIKPIIGTEFYLDPNGMDTRGPGYRMNHLILLAKDATGLESLNYLNTIAHVYGFYHKARIDWKSLVDHSQGLVCLSACLSSELGKNFLANDFPAIWETVEFYQGLFRDDYYLEIQCNSMPEQRYYNNFLKDVADLYNLPLVLTTDAHYLRPELARVHELLLCVQTGKTMSDPNRMKMSVDDFYLWTTEEVYKWAQDEQEIQAIENTMAVVDKCELQLTLGNLMMPSFDITTDAVWPLYLAELSNG
jgi:DNA polymerase-3 subunit alpha